ncbi:dienelactone hydrolase [Schizosaccharomyces japonicus yFS275]|uniref:Dienelactone hydrolase n=1 Tax=Schizosaccharomyces japonicus (strain yFS275 / FY16936) TaxID=402676 RepID=B6K380_SCHJY|nr:dienelactone hydrolase [Schizosaccharomyces japonicus yFS275]EEB07937.1 dienelactone hydrolase [Schizosaccharomyces japonicus yFS275]
MASCCPTNLGAQPPNEDHVPQGKIVPDIGGLTTYVSGPATGKRVVLMFEDIFGLSSQLKEGADLLGSHGFTAYAPDFLRGHALPLDSYPPVTPEHKKLVDEFMTKRISPSLYWVLVEQFLGTIRSIHGDDVKIGIVGYCWGAKVLTTHPFKGVSGVAMAHPSFLDPLDARNVLAPVYMIATSDEDKNAVEGFKREFASSPFHSQSHFEVFDDMHHGFMAARADLTNPANRSRFDEGYRKFIGFFETVLA